LFNIGLTEFLVLAIIILVCVDPRKLPEIARALARIIAAFKNATKDLKLDNLIKLDEREPQEKLEKVQSEKKALEEKSPHD